MTKADRTGLLGPANPTPIVRTGGRAAGTPNKTTVMLKEAVFAAGQLAGDRLDPKNKEHQGFVKYLAWLAKEYPNCYTTLLCRMIPHTIRANVSGDAVAPKGKVELQNMLRERGLPVENVFDLEPTEFTPDDATTLIPQ